MNPNTPYNTGALQNMVTKVKAYCAHIIPLVFDNTLSYYESICACVGKVNELCDAVNAQNLTIVEFTHLVEVELDKLSKYIDAQIEEIQNKLDLHEDAINRNHSDIVNLGVDVNTNTQDIGRLKEFQEQATQIIQEIRNTALFKTDISDSVTQGDETHVPSSNAVYEAIQNATGVTVRDAQANPTHGTIKGIVTTDFQQLANPLSITNGVMSMREATKNVTGYVQVGDNINVTNGVISVPEGSTTAVGVVGLKQTGAIEKTQDGIDVKTGDYVYKKQNGALDVPLATNTQLGIVAPKLGGALDIQSSGEIDAKDATTTQKGVVALTDTITDGDTTHVPTADAVYEALQQGGGGTIPDATTTTKGKVQIGQNIDVNSGVISVPVASTNSLGVMGVGNGLSINANGNVSITPADASHLGGVRVGDNIHVDTSGLIEVWNATDTRRGVVKKTSTISDNNTDVPTSEAVYQALQQGGGGAVPDATTSTKGKVQIGDNINVSSGVISVPDASALTKGVMAVGGGLSATQGLVYLAQATDSAIGGVKIGDGLKNDTNDKLTIDSDATLAINQSGKLTVRTATPDNVGLATIDGTNSNLTMSYGKIDVPTGSKNNKGVLQVGSNINVGNGVISVPTATPGTLGVATIADTGSNLTMGAGGVIDVPNASTSAKGVVQVGTGIEVTNGVISVPDATSDTKGKVKPGVGLEIATATPGIMTLATATQNTLGGFKVTDTITDGDTTHVPTANAVYDAVQTSGRRFLVPKPYGEAAYGDDIFISTSNSGVSSTPNIFNNYQVINNSFYSTNSNIQNVIYIWIKESALNLTSSDSSLIALSKIILHNTYTLDGSGITPSATHHPGLYPYYVFDYLKLSNGSFLTIEVI